MEDKVAATYLAQILAKYSLTDEEKEAVQTALGILSWTMLRKGALQRIKERREQRKVM